MNTLLEQPAKTEKKIFRQCKDCPLNPSKTKTVAKIGMVATLGASAASGILKFKGAKPLHLWASIAFIGFTALHYAVSKKPRRTTR
ncbi:hypothetical protein [Desulfovibrio sp. UCD-KL4C]|uniref:hypothetical protein n=1 Tax=Desulfovibrio sp. UCD-KL4C TaxID=2578120 RepID=UPI0025BDFFBF|nr:hypothetical protein [Desulfovibrio sp. UCD-KL4C]